MATPVKTSSRPSHAYRKAREALAQLAHATGGCRIQELIPGKCDTMSTSLDRGCK